MPRLDFKRRRRRNPNTEGQVYGLVVPQKELIISKDGVTIWDGVAERERAFRMAGGAKVIFEDEEPDEVEFE